MSLHTCVIFFLILRRHPKSSLFPYTTLFRSQALVHFNSLRQRRFLRHVRATHERVYIGWINGKSHEERKQPSAIEKRSEEHTSELQSLRHLVCRLLLEKKKRTMIVLESLGIS